MQREPKTRDRQSSDILLAPNSCLFHRAQTYISDHTDVSRRDMIVMHIRGHNSGNVRV